MTNQQHPITPPPELVQQWLCEFFECDPPLALSGSELLITARAAQWGADQELEACVAWLDGYEREGWAAQQLRSDRRPKPQTLSSIALQMLGTIERDAHYLPEITDTIRHALEALPE